MRGWFGDLGRLSWGLFYWNLQKSLFRARGASGEAPCQSPSDSGIAGLTGCDACLGWTDKSRFRRLCPLLEPATGTRHICSVAAEGVRPFWGRAFAFYGGSLFAVALVALVGVFSAYRVIGYRVPLYVLAWPPAWHRVQQARADYYYRMALRSYAAGDVRKCFLALGQVYILDPDNINGARLLAQFAQIANPDYSDAIYSRLLLLSRGDRDETAHAWFRALLARGDLAAMSGLSAKMLREGADHGPAWAQGLLFAEDLTADTRTVDGLLLAPGKIPTEARSVLSLAQSIRTGSKADRSNLVEISLGNATTPFEIYFSLNQMTEIGRAADVVTFLQGPEGAALSAYDRSSLELDAYSSLGWHVLEAQEVGFLLDQGASPSIVTLLSAHLVRYPNADTAEYVFKRLDKKPMPDTAANSGAHIALLCMAGVNGLNRRMHEESEILGRIVGGDFAASGLLFEFFESTSPSKNPAIFLPALAQLPLEVVYALTARYHAAALQATSLAVPANPPGGNHRTHAYEAIEGGLGGRGDLSRARSPSRSLVSRLEHD
jgi:hypothetical protein